MDIGLGAFLLYAGLPLTWSTGNKMIVEFFADIILMSVLLHLFGSGLTLQPFSGNIETPTRVYCCGASLELNLKVHVLHPCVTSQEI